MRETRNVRRQNVARRLLQERDLQGVEAWAREEKLATQALVGLTFDADALMRWRAIEALGPAAAIVHSRSAEKARRLIRRLLWLMNDESGGLCRHGPEAIGEVLRATPPLIAEFGRMLPPFFIEEPFERGSRLAVSRVAPVDATPFAEAIKPLIASLDDKDPGIRAASTLALRSLDRVDALAARKDLQADSAVVELYDFQTGELQQATVGEIVRSGLL